MEANNFIAKIKVSGVDSDNFNIGESLAAYLEIVDKLSSKDKSTFSLNVLCILCRNLDKAPKWRDSIDNTELLRLTIQCLRHTRSLEGSEHQVKTLACIYHIHKQIVRQTSSVPPELVLKLSFMPFEFDDNNLLKDYCKTYWSILCDRLTYIEKLKTLKMPIVKLMLKLTEDIIKTINIYDSVQFCTNLLQFLLKKVHFVFNDWPKDLNNMFGQIFDCISKKDLKSFKSLPEKESLDLYVKLNDILYIVTDNSLRNNFNHSVLDIVTRVCISLLGHRPDMFHCLQTFYLNSFCCIFKDKTNTALIENVLNSLLVSCQMTEKLGYKHTLHLTYPFISQLLRLFIEDIVKEKDRKDYFNETVQENCLILMQFLIKKLGNTNQLLKCENCKAKSGLHDALRLSFLVKHFVTISTNNGIDIKNYLSIYYGIVEQQYVILNDLRRLGCFNHEKYYRKLQTDVHNTAILLNKCQFYDFSIKLFELYLKNELKNMRSDAELKNISRALYNKSICELDFKLYNESLQNAYLSLIFSLPDGLNSEKYMNLVMDIKAKALKSLTEDDESNDLQMLSILDVCKLLYDDNLYGNLKPFMKNLKFSILLKHEFSMYIKLWPSIVPIAGVWKSLHDLLKKKHNWVKDENEDLLLWTLYEIVLQTPSYVRTIHNECFKDIVDQLLERFEETPARVQNKVVFASLLFLKAEYDITEASLKYGWKVPQTTDPEQVQVTRTIEQEHRALTHAVKAVDVLTDILPYLKTEKTPQCILSSSLQIWQVFVQQLLCMEQLIHGLHLALICCRAAEVCEDKQAYVRNASPLISHMTKNGEFEPIMKQATKYCGGLMMNVEELDVALVFLCEMACYYVRCERISVAAKLVETVQKKLLWAQENHPGVEFSLSTGSLLWAQFLLRPDSGLSTLSALNTIQRHYLATSSDSARWCARRTASLHAQRGASVASARCASTARALRTWRRALHAAAPRARLPARAAARAALAAVNTAAGDDALVKIDIRLKYILGLQASSDVTQTNIPKEQLFTPKQTNLETMRDCMFKKNQTSPSLPCIPIPAFKTPEFMSHTTCKCYACDPVCTILACNISFLESSTYFRAKEFDVARNYFNGTLKMFELAETKLKSIFDGYRPRFNYSVIKVIQNMYNNEFCNVFIEFLLEFAFFELSQNEFEKADDCIIKIHEIMSGTDVDPYLRNEVHNLMVASAQVREIVKLKPKEIGLENELENLKLSPAKETDLPKTPETKIMPKIETIKIVKDEEIPKKRKVIKLNLDETSPDEVEKAEEPQPKFKIPVPKPITSKPVLETITPRRTRSKPDITIQKPSLDDDLEVFTPKVENELQFFTPCQSTPAEQFFTPMTSLKTYSRRIVKNLESEFSTPKANVSIKEKNTQRKNKVESGSVKTLKDKRTLKRNTSPGKLVEEKPVLTRPRRIRQPVLTDNK